LSLSVGELDGLYPRRWLVVLQGEGDGAELQDDLGDAGALIGTELVELRHRDVAVA
jgi:hypothetical protein